MQAYLNKSEKWKCLLIARAGVACLVECCSVHLRVAGLIPGLGTYPGCRFDPWLRHIQEATYGCLEECQAEQKAENLCTNMLLEIQSHYNVRYKQWTWAWKSLIYQILQSLKAGLMSLHLNLSVLWYGQWRVITTEESSLSRQKPKVYRLWFWNGGRRSRHWAGQNLVGAWVLNFYT